MVTSSEGIKLIKSYEGFRSNAYICPAGVWTIGYGHTGGVHAGMTVTEAEAENLLKHDLRSAEESVNKTGRAWSQLQYDALVSFTFNCGAGNLARLLRNRMDACGIADAMLKYNKAGGVVLSGLIRRRRAEREMFLFGSAENGVFYPAYIGNSKKIDAVMESIGAVHDYDNTYRGWKRRHRIAEANGISPYKGTKDQNLALMEKAKSGTLRRV